MNNASSSFRHVARFMGLETNRTGHLEKWLSAAGGLTGILAITLISRQFLPDWQEASWVVASMGASAVLLFAVPHGPLSQPWPVLGGHLVSAVIGVTCAQMIPEPVLAAPLAVGIAIGAMHYLRCIHPPGGATALTAVIGGAGLHSLGYQYVLTPVLLNALVMVLIALAFNYPFHWRRYPAALAVPRSRREPQDPQPPADLSEDDLDRALQAMNSTIDISGQDLAEIYRLARRNQVSSRLKPSDLQPGHYYSNGQYGADWQVRQIIDMATPMKSPDDVLIYKVVAGANRRSTGTISFEDFARWASYEVFLNENSWQRMDYAEVPASQQ